MQANHPVAEHGEEEGRHHPHGHNVKQQHCCVVGWGPIRPGIPFPALCKHKSWTHAVFQLQLVQAGGWWLLIGCTVNLLPTHSLGTVIQTWVKGLLIWQAAHQQQHKLMRGRHVHPVTNLNWGGMLLFACQVCRCEWLANMSLQYGCATVPDVMHSAKQHSTS